MHFLFYSTFATQKKCRYKDMKWIKFLLVTLIFFSSLPGLAQYTFKGIVLDSLTQEPLPYMSLYFKELNDGCTTNMNGEFSFNSPIEKLSLRISAMGYKDNVRVLQAADTAGIRILLVPTVFNMKEVIVHKGKEKYNRDNPAVRFVREMIRHRDDNDPDQTGFWKRDRYEKTTFYINEFDTLKQKKWLYRKFTFLNNYVDTLEESGTPVLAVSDRELLATDYYREGSNGERQVVRARRQAGIDEMFSQQGMEQVIQVTMTDVDIFQNNISLFTNKFVSPLSKMGPSFYKYYLMDTVVVNNERCVDLTFVPFNSESFGFTGHLFVSLDGSYFVHKVKMNFPKKINLNFVDHMSLEQNFRRTQGHIREMTDEKIMTNFKLTGKDDGMYACRSVKYQNYAYEPTPEDETVFNHPQKVIEESYADTRTSEYWAEMTPKDTVRKATSVDKMMKQLRSVPVFYWTEKVLKILFTGYIPIPEEKPVFYYGIMNTTISGNALEGVRLRAGGMTTARVNPHLFARGYVAYGFKDQRVKGLAELEYSFKKKKEYANEFPIHSLRLSYKSDVDQYGQHYLYTSQDNVFLALKRHRDDRIGYQQKCELTYTNEFYSGFSYQLTTRLRRDEASHLVPFVRQRDGSLVESMQNTELEIKLRYAPNEKFFQTQWNRYPVSLDAPIFTLSHVMAARNILGGDYRYHHTEFGFQKRFWFSAFGYTDVILKAGKIWNKVPFPLLIIPNANLSYTIQPESYSLMNAMEFINDQYASWDVTYYLNGFLFNRIPLLKKLKWREVIGCKGMFGYLSEKNRPQNHDDLLTLPYGSRLMQSNVPYVEMNVGIENIFKILRIDYVRRLTYKNLPYIDKHGVRISLHMTF